MLNGAANVREDLRTKVLAAIEETSYRPNALARGLRNRRSRTVGLIIPDITNPFFSELAKAVELEATRRGYCLILSNSMDSSSSERSHMEALFERSVDGIILAPAIGTFALPANDSIPIVVLDRDVQGECIRLIRCDNYGGAVAATRYLVQLGHRNIAFVGGPEQLGITQERRRGYDDVLASVSVEKRHEACWYGAFDYNTGVEAAQYFFSLEDPPTAIFTSNDQQAIGVLRAAADAGVAVPAQLSIIGFDDIALSERTIPRLTTVAQPIQLLGATAVDLALTRGIRRAQRSTILTLPVSLVVRETTGPVAAARRDLRTA